MSRPLLPRLRHAGLALVVGTAFLFAATESAVASTVSAGPGLPEPTPIVLFEDDLSDAPMHTSSEVAPEPEASDALAPDVPVRVPAQMGAGKAFLWLFALIGIAALVVIGIVVYGVYTLMNSDV